MAGGNSIKTPDIMEIMIAAGGMKSKLPWLDMIVRGIYSGFMLGIATSFNAASIQQTNGLTIIGSLLFPSGFMMIIFYSFELITGNMMTLTMAWLAGTATGWGWCRNYFTVLFCNFWGTILYVAFFYGAMTNFGMIPNGGPIGQWVITIGQNKTKKYVIYGGLGWAGCFFKSILANFLVSFAILGSIASTSAVGKVVVSWFPVIMFAILGYEHVVVNMYVIPSSMTLGSGVTWGEWWGWNMAPAFVGNNFGAIVMVAFPFWFTHCHQYREKQRAAKKAKELEEAAALQAKEPVSEGSDSAPPMASSTDFGAGYSHYPSTPNSVSNSQSRLHSV